MISWLCTCSDLLKSRFTEFRTHYIQIKSLDTYFVCFILLWLGSVVHRSYHCSMFNAKQILLNCLSQSLRVEELLCAIFILGVKIPIKMNESIWNGCLCYKTAYFMAPNEDNAWMHNLNGKLWCNKHNALHIRYRLPLPLPVIIIIYRSFINWISKQIETFRLK